ncbi:MAG: ROK family protein [Pseudomonadota bacterium]
MTAFTEPLCAVVDFGGTKIATALVRGRSILERQQVATDGAAPAEAHIDSIATLLKPFLPKTTYLGVALTGRVHNGIWQPLNLETLAGFAQIDVRAELAATLGTPVVVLNDALAAAWGEYRLGAGRGATDMLYITVSTGVGGGFILDLCDRKPTPREVRIW